MIEPPDSPVATTVTPILARLVREPPLSCGAAAVGVQGPIYRPLIVGPAILRRPGSHGEAWRVSLVPGVSIRPRCPGNREAVLARVRALRRAGVGCRVAAALVAPEDIPATHEKNRHGRATRRPVRCRSEFYGWSLLYLPTGGPRIGLIEPHPTFPDLPAFFASPLALLERSEALARRGIRSRAIALLTQPEDFEERPDGTLTNRYVPVGMVCRPPRLDWLA